MIMDTLDHAGQYCGLGPDIARALDFLGQTATTGLPEGRHAIDGDRIYAVISSYRTRQPEDIPFEAHREYVDIQYLASGAETVWWMPREGCAVRREYAAGDDIELLSDGPSLCLALHRPVFLVFFPQDAHKPGCVAGRSQDVRKIVIKVTRARTP
jgi:biofilm protein TabA